MYQTWILWVSRTSCRFHLPSKVIVQLTSCDGAVAACAGNAAHLALLDAGVAMKATAMCIALAVTWKNLDVGMLQVRDQWFVISRL